MNNQVKLIRTDIIALEVPREATDVSLGSLGFELYFKHEGVIKYITIGNVKLELLGEATETEISFDVEPYVKEIEIDVERYDGIFEASLRYLDYIEESFDIFYKNESFYSLLQASGIYFVNPIEKLDISDFDNGMGIEYDNFENHKKQWQEAESKVIKGKLIFLKPV